MWHKIELKGLILSVALVRTYIIKFSEVNPVILYTALMYVKKSSSAS